MKRITTHNYEEFAIDYMVGNLSTPEAEAFTSFLVEHPHIADEILLFETGISLSTPEKASFKALKQDIGAQRITDDNFEEYCIAAMEGDLNTAAEAQLKAYIGKDAIRLAVMAQFENTKLTPETHEYRHKESLKKAVHVPFFGRRLIKLSAIASAASIVAFGLFLLPSKNDIPVQVADNTTAIENNTPEQQSDPVTMAPEEKAVPALLAKAAPVILKPVTQTTNNSTTSNREEDEGIKNTNEILEKLRSKRASLPNTSDIAMNKLALVKPTPEIRVATETTDEASSLRSKTSKLLYSTVFAKSVEGINRMAETDLGYNVVEDDEGNPVRVIITSRFGEINRTLAQR